MSLLKSLLLNKSKCTITLLPSYKSYKLINSQRRGYAIRAASLDRNKEIVKVDIHDGHSYEFPWIFLQDNCTCPSCFHPSSQSRLRKITDLNLDNAISSVEIVSDKSAMRCNWIDGHQAEFSEKWLAARRFTKEQTKIRKAVLRDEPELVGSNLILPRDSFKNVLGDNNRMLNMLEKVSKMGVFLLNGAEKEVGQLKKLANQIGFIRLTHYGHEFTVKSEPNAVNLAYTSAHLGVHTDLPYYVYPPGVQFLHCIKQYSGDDGGQSQLVDGFNVAKQMKQMCPDQYKILCNTPVEFSDTGTDYIQFDKVHHSPTFVLHPEKKVLIRIVYSNQQLSSIQPMEVHEVKPFYTALKMFNNFCYKPENLIEFKLKEGEILIFDNWRMLHGRRSFDPSKGSRHLEGCYIDWDEIYSRIRVIKML